MKIKLDKLTVTEVEVEMPDVCPHCKANWKETGLIEGQLVAASQTCGLYGGIVEGHLQFDDYSSSDLFYEQHYITDYMCSNCHEVIAEVPGEDPQQEKIQGA